MPLSCSWQESQISGTAPAGDWPGPQQQQVQFCTLVLHRKDIPPAQPQAEALKSSVPHVLKL